MESLGLLIVWALLGGFFTSAIWQNKGGKPGGAFVLGALFGIFAIIYVAASSPTPSGKLATRECPHCKKQIRRDASVCPHCQRESTAWKFHDNYWWSRDEAGTWFWLHEQSGDWIKKV